MTHSTTQIYRRPLFPMNADDARIAAREDSHAEYLAALGRAQASDGTLSVGSLSVKLK